MGCTNSAAWHMDQDVCSPWPTLPSRWTSKGFQLQKNRFDVAESRSGWIDAANMQLAKLTFALNEKTNFPQTSHQQ